MKTLWGACNPAAGRVWLNLALFRALLPAIEYVVVRTCR